jgi:hypothetical protein
MATTAVPSVSVATPWLNRGRFALATLVTWAGLHYVVGALLPHGLDRPLALAFGGGSALAGPALILVIWVAAMAGAYLQPADGPRYPLMAIGLGLALWAFEGGRMGGTMDSWLKLQNPIQGPPTRGPYWRLLPDYLYLLLAIGGACWIARRITARSAAAEIPPSLPATPRARVAAGQGAAALGLATAVAGVLMFVLPGPPGSATLRGQVYFAVAVAFIAGVYAAQRLLGVRDPAWYWPAPLLLGAVGLVVAGVAPGLALPAEYRTFNSIPAWGLARGLPVEMVGVGVLAAMWMIRPAAVEDGAAAGRTQKT